jgi:anhydro-N-acetylmuramic acid kinase
VDAQRAATLLELLRAQRTAARSLGTGDEARAWLDAERREIAPRDMAATAVRAIAACAAEALEPHRPDEVLIAGGGARNLALVDAIRAASRSTVREIDAQGMPVEAREASAIAILGALAADGVPITLPQVTGCAQPAPVAGSWCLPRQRGSDEAT